MLKKSDLAKQFELVVQQEIKNYQNSLNFMLNSLNEIKETIRVVQQESLENHALIHSIQCEHSIELKNLIVAFQTEQQKLKSYINDFESYKKISTAKMEVNYDYALENSRKNEFYKNSLDEIKHNLETLEDEIAGHSITISNSIENIRYSVSKDLKRLKEEILSMPSDSIQIKNDLEEKIANHTVDVDGIMRELRVYKNDNMVTQKKIENIYTLIERLKKSEVNP